MVDPARFVSSQLGHIQPHRLYETEQCLALQMGMSAAFYMSHNPTASDNQSGNLYLLLSLLGLFILNTTTEPRVVHAYILALLIGDIGHVAASVYVMGYDATIDVGKWNDMAWGNIGVTIFLFFCRSCLL